MPSVAERGLYQTACLWPFVSYGADGQPTVSTAIDDIDEISVRWEPVNRETTDPFGNKIAIEAMAKVNQEVTVHSRLWLGAKVDLPSTNIPTTGWMVVVKSDAVPNTKGRSTARELSLARYKDS